MSDGKEMSGRPEPHTEVIVPRTEDAIEFLRGWHPKGPWHLVAIPPDGRPVAQSFTIAERDQAYAWIERHQGTSNLYFHLNELRPGVTNRKAKKEDIEWAVGLHVDIDDLSALAPLQQFDPPPTALVFSGGGYQAFWRFETPVLELALVEAINATLAAKLGGDNCHNIDRIMRLPGTINVPNQKKRDRGRTERLAYLIGAVWERLYRSSQFDVPETHDTSTSIAVRGLITLAAIADLPASISDFTRALIELGDDPERPRGLPNARYRSRSEPLFRVVCDLIRANCTDDVILGVVLNPNFAISRSVLDKRNPRAYALQQITSARIKLSADWPDMAQRGHLPRATYRNALLAIQRLDISTTHDVFHNRMYVGGHILQEYQGELTDLGAAFLRQLILREFSFDPGKDQVRDAVQALCIDHQFHPILDYLARLKWDQTERLPTWLNVYLGAEDSPLNREIGQIVLVAAVRRIRHPGTKFDTIPVFEGPQGSGKSTALLILSGSENFSDQNILALDSKAQMEALEGVWIYEISELEGLSRADVARVKAFASRSEDRGRPAYGRYRENRPRYTIFIGTTNDDQYLRDQTGNRRFWPVRTGTINLEALRQDRNQLWAEAAHKEDQGSPIVLRETLWDAAGQQQNLRMEDEPWLDILREVKGEKIGGEYRVSSKDLLTTVIGIPKEYQLSHMNKRIASLMRKLGWKGPTLLRFADGSTGRGYSRAPDQAELDLTPKK